MMKKFSSSTQFTWVKRRSAGVVFVQSGFGANGQNYKKKMFFQYKKNGTYNGF